MPWREGRACHAPSASPKPPLTQETTNDAPHVLLLPRPSPVLCIFWDMTASSSHVVACARVRCYQGMVTLLPTVNGGAVMVVWWFCFQGGTTVLPARCQCVIQCVAREGCNAAYRSRRATGGRRCCKDLAEDLLKWCDDTIVFFFCYNCFFIFLFVYRNCATMSWASSSSMSLMRSGLLQYHFFASISPVRSPTDSVFLFLSWANHLLLHWNKSFRYIQHGDRDRGLEN
jgi:hypothetical protein